MKILKAKQNDIENILKIYKKARDYMRKNGNLYQWTNGYPKRELIEDDIKNQKCYICLDQDRIAAVFYFDKYSNEPTYNEIYEGNWICDKPYGVIHRIAVSIHKKGVASFCINWCLNQCGNIKIDTHEDNIPMQKMLDKNGFTRCGIIYLKDKSKRVAYQKTNN